MRITGAVLCFMFANYDIGVFAFITPSLLSQLHLSVVDLGFPLLGAWPATVSAPTSSAMWPTSTAVSAACS